MLAFVISSALTTTPSSGISLGIVLGDPTGLSLKFWGVGRGMAAQIHVGGGGFVSPAKLAVHGSFLFHTTLTRQTPINGYIGPGLIVGMSERRGVIAFTMPIGLEFVFSEVPLDVFVEVPPVIGMTTEGDPVVGFSIGVGLRVLLK